MSQIPLIDCENKDQYDLLSILLNAVYIDSSDGLWYLQTSGNSGGGVTINSQQVNLVNGANPFTLLDINGDPYSASIVQFYELVAGTLHAIPGFDYLITGTTIIINNAGDPISNIVIKFI